MKPHPRHSDKIDLSIHFDFPANRKPSADFIIKRDGETYRAAELLGSNYHAAIAILALLIGNGVDSETLKHGNPLTALRLPNNHVNQVRRLTP